jgi:hypothetical protein
LSVHLSLQWWVLVVIFDAWLAAAALARTIAPLLTNGCLCRDVPFRW